VEGVGGEDGEGEEVLFCFVSVCRCGGCLSGFGCFLRERSELPLWCEVWETWCFDVAPSAGAEWRNISGVRWYHFKMMV